MQKFKKIFNEKRNQFKICLFENNEIFWPLIEGWTQEKVDVPINTNDNEYYYSINYFHDNKNFNVCFDIKSNKYSYEYVDGNWHTEFWGKEHDGIFKSEKNINAILKKILKQYELDKVEAIKKIPEFPDWKRTISDTEIVFSKKQNNRTVIARITSICRFIAKNYNLSIYIGIYDDSMSTRVTENEYIKDGNRFTFKNIISKLNYKYFK